MTNEEKAMNLSGICSNCDITTSHINWCQRRDMYDGAIEMAKWKDEQFIEDLGGWKTEPPTFDCYCLIETDDFPKNCHYIVAEWDNNAKHFYSESDDEPVSFERYKIIHKA